MSIYEPLEAALRAATAPGHPEELAGEDAAVAAFRAAAPAPRRSLLARVFTVRAVVIGVAALSTAIVLVVAGLVPFPSGPSSGPATVPPVQTSVPEPASNPAVPPPDGSVARAPAPPSPLHPSSPRSSGVGGGPGPDEYPDRGKEREREVGPRGPKGRNQTPGSPARGAGTAVPPNGAKPPSPGG
ncbi:hypothetical protein [Actinophytocola sp.]|uniref:hypothetical protein n=1 Tax=Actinophytocola sp. TaxID=1872138 RepID=UPI003899A86C